jgi:hypothetical protein
MPTLASPKKASDKKLTSEKNVIKQRLKSLAEQRKLIKLQKVSVGKQQQTFNFTNKLIPLGEATMTSVMTELKPTQQSTVHQELKPVKVAESFDDWK